MRTLVLVVLLAGFVAAGQTPLTALNPTVKQIVDAISEERVRASLQALEGFGTRHVESAKDDPAHGIGAAQRWIYDQFKSYSPRLEVSTQPFTVKRGGRDFDLANVVAVLPGGTERDRVVLVSGHYDSVNLDDLKGAAPGVSDDASGTAAVLELARVMSQYRFDKTVVFAAFSSEEGSHAGSQAYAANARKTGMQIEAVLNNDIIGNDAAGNGRSANRLVRAFAGGPEDSPSRAVLRYVKEIGERYVPSMQVEMVFHLDRFLRGGDHMSFFDAGYGAVRLTTASENYANQHSATDTLSNGSVPYTTRVTRVNAAAAASLALAPATPVVNSTATSGRRQSQSLPMLSRGESGYDAVLRWQPSAAPDLAGYAVVIRASTSPVWEREIWVGNVTSYTLPDFSIDNVVLGVKAVDREGNPSLVAAYLEPAYRGDSQ